jgi:hypothetical protein
MASRRAAARPTVPRNGRICTVRVDSDRPYESERSERLSVSRSVFISLPNCQEKNQSTLESAGSRSPPQEADAFAGTGLAHGSGLHRRFCFVLLKLPADTLCFQDAVRGRSGSGTPCPGCGRVAGAVCGSNQCSQAVYGCAGKPTLLGTEMASRIYMWDGSRADLLWAMSLRQTQASRCTPTHLEARPRRRRVPGNHQPEPGSG